MLCLASLVPHVTSGQEWRLIIGNFTEFLTRSVTDWEKFTPTMREALNSPTGLKPENRWAPRCLRACVFCARLKWAEVLREEYIAGPSCTMADPARVCELISCARYEKRWPLIPVDELRASAIELPIASTESSVLVLLHKRRVSESQRVGEEPVAVCPDCFDSFFSDAPWLGKYALANDLWLGRWDLLFRNANLAHQMSGIKI